MVRYTLDPDTCRRLDDATQIVELCDDAGRVIGFFLPGVASRGQLPAGLKVPLTVGEIERRRTHRSGRALAEIVRSVESR